MTLTPLGSLDRRIAAALLRNGRASWRLIAQVLDEPERRVARHGAQLLESGAVRVHGLADPRSRPAGESTFVRVAAHPAALRAVAERMADDPRTTWVSLLGGPTEVVGEYLHTRGELADIIADLAAEDVVRIDARPQLHFHRTVAGWSPGILEPAQLEALRESEDAALARQGDFEPPDATTARLIELIAHQGRATVDELGQALDVSKSTISRRLESAISRGQVNIRAVVDPALLGLPVETVLTVDVAPGRVDEVGALVARSAAARWVMDDGAGVIAQLAHRDREALRQTLTDIGGHPGIRRLKASQVLGIAKRSTIRYRDGAPVALAG